MALDAGEIILWAAIFGLLVGIIWALKYIVIIDRRIERIEMHVESLVRKSKVKRRR